MQRATRRLVAIDLDGTLLGSAGQVSAGNAAALRKAAANGALAVPATARWYQAAIRPFEPLGVEIAAIAAAGADVRLDGSTILERPLPPEFATFIAELAERGRWAATLSTPPRAYRLASEMPPWAANAPEWLQPVTHLRDADLSCLLSVLAEVEPGDPHLAELEAWRERLTLHEAVSYRGDTMITITAAGVNKGSGLRALCEAAGIRPEDAIAIGDSAVDIPMFEVAGTAVAMANASDEVKARATFVTTSADEDGVAEALRRLGLV